MSNNKLNLLFQFTGIDKVSDNIKNIVGAGKRGAESMREMQREVRLMEKDLARVQRTLAKGGSQSGGLIMAERELAEAIERTNRQIAAQEKKLQRVETIRAGAGKVAGALGRAGAYASASITAPLGIVMNSVDNLAERTRGLKNAANVAGMGFEQFQRDAYAARSLNIEYEKFGDILKDTQDKIGDFTANGGGEMADFFKNIAPKVGVTAKSFRDLSGADALQLYYNSLEKAGVSHKEMVFYMEAIADEGSGLIPILKNNGAGMREMGSQAAVISASDAAGLEEYTQAQMRLSNSTTKLNIALGKSGLIDTMTWLSDQGAKAADWFGTLSPGAQRVAVVLGMVAAVAGPLLIFFGAIASSVATLAPVFAAVGGGIAAIAGGVGTAMGFVGTALATVVGVVGAVPILIAAAVAAVGVAAYMIYKHWDQVKSAVSGGIAWLKDVFNTLPGWMRNIGSMMMQGLLMSLNPALLAGKLIGIAKSGVTAFKNYFGIKSPSRLFMEMGGHINEGLGIGLEKGKGRPVRAVGRMAGAVAGAGAMALSPAAAAPRAQQSAAPAKIEIHIHQMPGENSEALAQRVAELVEQAQRQNARRGYGDDF